MLRSQRAALEKPLMHYLIALGIVIVAYWLRYGVVRGLGIVLPPYFTFYPAIMFAAVFGGLLPGLFATALSVLAIDLFILDPLYSLKIANFPDVVALSLFALIGVLISFLAERFRRGRQTIAELRQKQALWITNAKLELALASMTDAVFISDEKGNLIHFNYAFATFYRFPGTTDCPKNRKDYQRFLEVSRPGGEPLPLDKWPIACALRGEAGTGVEFCLRRKDTGETWLGSYNYAPFRDEDGLIIGAVVAARDITQSRQAEELLRQSELHYRNLFTSMDEGGCVVEVIFDAEGKPVDLRFVEVNPAYEKLTGLPIKAGQRIREYLPNLEDYWLESYAKVALTGQPGHFVNTVKETGGIYDVHSYRVGEPELRQVAVIFNEVSERIRAEEHIKRLNRVYSVLSDINQTIVRVKDSQAILEAACQIAVEKGRFQMAWIGMVSPETCILAPIVSAGHTNGYLDQMRIDLRDPATGPAAQAFHSGRHVVCNNIEQELYRPWKSFAVELGYRSMAAFPLSVDGQVKGIVSLYAAEVGFFDDDELHLLDEMAMDISFALEVNLHEQERRRAQIDIERLNRVYALLSEINKAIVRVKDSQAILEAACQIAVEKGKFLMAWAGLINPDTGILVPVASAGCVGSFLDGHSIDVNDPAVAARSISMALFSGHHDICNNIENLPPESRRRTIGYALGYRSAASFPLIVEGSPVGVINFYAGEVDFFNDNELRLLDEMAMDLSFSLEVDRHEQARLLLEANTGAHLRELQILNEMNEALLEANSEKELLQSWCRIAVETAGYRMAWVGFAEQVPEKRVVPIAWAGYEDGYLSVIKVTWDGGELSQGPTGRAVLSRHVECTPYIATLPGMIPFQAEAEKRGYKASIAIPFETEPGSMACVSVYSAERIEWSQAEQHLMQKVAHALGYGIRTLRGTIAREQYLDQIRNSLENTVELIAETVDRRDPYTAGHQRRVAELSVRIARKLAVEEEKIRGLRLAATIHDLGKIGIPAEILAKPTALSKVEFALVKEHVQIGYDIVKDIAFPWPIADMILQHHERMNGSGYPQALCDDAMLLESRIMAVADVVEAMATHRPYRPSRGIDAALEELLKDRGTLYDSAVVDACVSIFREDGYQFTG
jgi:HD-GYP domain-containing protein (c-di-GMP phosphodiesterase class II)/PAS domain-containing protein